MTSALRRHHCDTHLASLRSAAINPCCDTIADAPLEEKIHTMNTGPLLTIAIPTWNRAPYLQLLLTEIQKQRALLPSGTIELVVCDNHSEDTTPEVVNAAMHAGQAIHYIRHAENIGSDCNIATCFNVASGRYVWIMGDDDLPVDGTLSWLSTVLSQQDYALVYLRPFGFDQDFRTEQPRTRGKHVATRDLGEFLSKVGAQLNLISAMIVNKALVPTLDARQFCGSNLVHVEIYLTAARQLASFFYSTSYRVAYKRNNFGPYDFSKVFVTNLGAIFDRHCQNGLPLHAVRRMQNSMLVQYFPQYVLKMRWNRDEDRDTSHSIFKSRFRNCINYWLFIEPIFSAPRPIAICAGLSATFIGRSLSGDLRRGLAFLYHKIFHRGSAAKRAQ